MAMFRYCGKGNNFQLGFGDVKPLNPGDEFELNEEDSNKIRNAVSIAAGMGSVKPDFVELDIPKKFQEPKPEDPKAEEPKKVGKKTKEV